MNAGIDPDRPDRQRMCDGCRYDGLQFLLGDLSSLQTNAIVLHRASRNKATGHILGRLGRSRLFGMETVLQAKTVASWEALPVSIEVCLQFTDDPSLNTLYTIR